MQHNSSPATSTRTTIHNLNARTLQTVVTAITKDLCVDWSGEIPTWWSEDIPFCKPCTIPPSHKGTLLDEVEHEFHVCTNRNSLCIYVCMYVYYAFAASFHLLSCRPLVWCLKEGYRHAGVDVNTSMFDLENTMCNGFMCVDCLPFTNNVIDNGLCFYCSLIIYIQLH